MIRPPNITPRNQEIDFKFNQNTNEWQFGFVQGNEAGILAEGKFINNTEVNYIVGTYHLIKVDGGRTLIKSASDNIASNPSIITQFLKTIKKSDLSSTASEYWLDTHAPQDDKGQAAIVFPAKEDKIELVNDIPSIYLNGTTTVSGSQYYSGGCFINEEFLLCVFAKPTEVTDIYAEDPEYYKSIWFPIAVYKWSWSGQATYLLSINRWKIEKQEIKDLDEISISSFSSWPKVAVGGVEPDWRDL